uniref:Glutathione transferase n=1 Tax=Prasinoderma coloniale TaxID=156133 RepID=A0A7R9TDG6_9VIRI|mmetsp:Transcript_12974/g.54379  ORF Transcript_12974/g.54379 Transcript_12974/m.54379 type:complete len:273 (+) Transcript_12974:92-910(+)|eukprot:PRCOL_00002493-RA
MAPLALQPRAGASATQWLLLGAGVAVSTAAAAGALFSWLTAPRQPRSLELEYFDVEAKGEPIRLLAAHLGLELKDTRMRRAEFMANKEAGKYPFGQVPLLIASLPGGEERIAQTNAIARYLCRLRGAHPHAAEAAAEVDALLDYEHDATKGLMIVKYGDRFGIKLTDSQKEIALKTWYDSVLPLHLQHLEAYVAKSRTGWLANTPYPTAADFVWACQLRDLLSRAAAQRYGQDCGSLRAAAPMVCSFIEKFYSLPSVVAYYGAKRTLDDDAP